MCQWWRSNPFSAHRAFGTVVGYGNFGCCTQCILLAWKVFFYVSRFGRHLAVFRQRGSGQICSRVILACVVHRFLPFFCRRLLCLEAIRLLSYFLFPTGLRYRTFNNCHNICGKSGPYILRFSQLRSLVRSWRGGRRPRPPCRLAKNAKAKARSAKGHGGRIVG